MKKIAVCLLALWLAMTLIACDPSNGGNDDTTAGGDTIAAGTTDGVGTTDQNPSAESGIGSVMTPNFGEILGGTAGSDTVWGKTDAATKAAIIESGRAQGVEVSFAADGTMTVRDTNTGNTVIQRPDGTWSISDDAGNQTQIGGAWPENDLTKLIPKPSFALSAAGGNDGEFSVMFVDVALEDVKAYAEEVKAAGFTLEPESMDMSTDEGAYFIYAASNADGYRASVFMTGDLAGVSVTAP